MINPSDSAFPVGATETPGHVAPGLTKHEYLAAKMMAALVSTLVAEDKEHPFNLEQQSKSFAIAAVAYADALIAELNKPTLPSEMQPEVPALEESAPPLTDSPDI